ncbi:MAG: endonuclease/exonuclease/phosphatase family protein [Methylotenera sp.]|nr:endonuclease/exonuclease/phosphatase family protein [Oligoflexia bacterium]
MEKRKLRVLSYNIHKGFSTGNRNFVLKQMKQAINSVHADLVFLQEVLGHHEVHGKKVVDWPTAPQFEYLSDELWPHYAYGKNAIYTAGHHGNAILSKYPFSFFENIDISTNKLEKRGLLHGIIEIPHKKKPLHAICLHLGLIESERQIQIQQLCDRIDSLVPHDEPLVIAGDFNDWRVKVTQPLKSKAEVKEVFQELHGDHARTFPSWLPALKLDRIYVRGVSAHSAVCLTGRPWSQLSDHVALYSELTV